MGCCCTKSEPDAPAFDPVIGLSHKLKSGGVQVKGSTISGDGSLLGDSPVLQDKAYFEVTVVTPGTFAVGLATKETPLDGVLSQDKAATAWTLTSSLQALGPLEGGEVIGCALDQGDYPVQVRHRVPTAVVRRASMPRLAHTTHPLRRAGLLLPRRQGDPPDQRHPWRGVCRLQRLGRRSARGQLWRQGLCGRHTFWLPGTLLPRVAPACRFPCCPPTAHGARTVHLHTYACSYYLRESSRRQTSCERAAPLQHPRASSRRATCCERAPAGWPWSRQRLAFGALADDRCRRHVGWCVVRERRERGRVQGER